MNAPPPGVAPKIWLVIWPDGQRNYIHRIDDIAAWAKGVNATVIEYRFSEVIHNPPPVKKK